MAKSVVFMIKFQSKGLYEWGSGWIPEKARLWHQFWTGIRPNYWTLCPRKMSASSDYLICSGCSIYLHPMGFKEVFCRPEGGKSERFVNGKFVEVFPAWEELQELMQKCSEFVGFEYSLTASEPQEIEFEFSDGKTTKIQEV